MTEQSDFHERMAACYASGKTPWDDVLPPPEVIDLVGRLPSGRALDLGCGYGRTAVYLARHGWQIDAVDFVGQAVQEAKERAQQAGMSDQITFHEGDITQLSFLIGQYDLAVDIGCAHALEGERWSQHYAELLRLLKAGGIYLLYGRVRDLTVEGDRGLNEPALLDLLSTGFRLTCHEPGMTYLDDGTAWRSAWYWWERC